MKPVLLGVAAAAALVTVAAAESRAPGAADTIRMRQANYKQMGAAMRGIQDQLRSGSPSVADIRRHSALIARFAPRLLRWFPHGSGAEAGIRTRARPEIWTARDGFTRAGAGLVVAARNFDAVARRGDVAAIRAAAPALAHACSVCHDDYRAPEH